MEKIAGRIIAHYDRRHNEYFNEKRGCIGFFDCINDREVSRALFKAAEMWLAQKGMVEMYGPMNFLLYNPSGLLVDDFDNVPVVELSYNPPYYNDFFADYGFYKVIDWYAYRIKREQKPPEVFYRIRDRLVNGKNGVVFRNLNLKKYAEETVKLGYVFNTAWEENWGHIPLSEKQYFQFAKEMKSIVKPELVIIAEHEGEVAGFILSIPDVNQALKRANGRLFPFGLIKLMLGMRKIDKIKTFMMGVLPKYRKKGLETVFILETFERAVKMGYKEADCSLIVENNHIMINTLAHIGAQKYKTYRHFSKPITL